LYGENPHTTETAYLEHFARRWMDAGPVQIKRLLFELSARVEFDAPEESRAVVSPGVFLRSCKRGDEGDFVLRGELWAAYEQRCQGRPAVGRTEFYQLAAREFGKPIRRREGHGFRGLRPADA
jgi:hypothetical protein